MANDWHIVPVDDLVPHETDERCVCGPEVQPVARRDGSMGFLYVHHALDGREVVVDSVEDET